MAKFNSRKPVIPVPKTKVGFGSNTAPAADTLVQLAIAAHQAGKLAKAEKTYRQALSHDKRNALVHSNLGLLLKESKRFPEAEASFRRALELKPDFADAHNNLGALLIATNRLPEAEASFRCALESMPNHVNALLNLASLKLNQKCFKEAFHFYTKVAELNPENKAVLRAWAQALKSAVNIYFPYNAAIPHNIPHDEGVFSVLSLWLNLPETFVSDFARPTYQLLKYHPVFNKVMLQICSDQWEKDLDYDEVAQSLSSIPLLIQIMSLSYAIDPELETMLSRLRKAMLLTLPSRSADSCPAPFSVSLAMFCFDNDYVFFESEQERIEINAIAANLSDSINEEPINWHAVVALSSYRPLHHFPWNARLLTHALSESLNRLVRQQIIEPSEELRIRNHIPKLGEIDDSVSKAVQDMYQNNPFPRWIKPTFNDAAISFSDVLCQAGCEPMANKQRIGPDSKILVAGCGTGQHAILTSSKYPLSQVTAIDLSLTSLAYAARKSQELGITNIRFIHGDLLQLASLGEQFDWIECVGVLHHMADPMSGWRALVEVLKPGGIMKIGLYSERARQSIVKIRGMIAAQQISRAPDEIRRLRQEILAKAVSGDLEMYLLMGVRDFFSLNECVDLLFHVQEHRFSLLKIESMIKELELDFLGLSLPNREVLKQFSVNFGADANPKNLRLWDEYEQHYPDTFIGMYNFFVSK